MNNKVLAILFFFSLVSCGSNSFQNKLEKDSLELVLSEQPKLTDEELKDKFMGILHDNFGKMAKVTKWGETSRFLTTNSLGIEGEISAVVRGDKDTYAFSAAVSETGQLDFLQMHHKGTLDYHYDCANNVRLDDETEKSQFKFKGIKLTVLGTRKSAIRYITSRKMQCSQIMEFIIDQTDMKRSNYYFQMSESVPEYATYIGDENTGNLFLMDEDKILRVIIDDNGNYTFE